MQPTDPYYYRVRAVAFAGLALTEQGNAAVKEYAGRDMAIDLLVEVLKNQKSTLRFFGVQLLAEMDLPTGEEAEKRVLSHPGREPNEAALPLCVVFVGVRKPEGIFRWTVEPVVEEGRALLRPNALPTWEPFDARAAAQLIAQVDAWYDARSAATDPPPRGRRARATS